MFAVIKTGGKQYRVNENDIIEVELLKGEVGDTVTFGEILLTGDGKTAQVGAPKASGVVEGKIVAQKKAPKVFIQYHRRRKNSDKRIGHRQKLTCVRITSIKGA